MTCSSLPLGLLALIAAVLLPGAAATARPPNLVLIMADDLGYETLGCNGGESYATPRLDRLAADGARFTRCFAQPLCTPTRVQLMTGLSNKRNYRSFGEIDPAATTFANLLRDAGYATCIAGKWQLGQDPDLPRRLGFDEACLWQHTRRPPRYANPGLEINGQPRDYTDGSYGPDLVNDFVCDFIGRMGDRPFLVYYPMILTHSPYQPTPQSTAWDPQASGEKRSEKRFFADMVTAMDRLVGRVVDRLDDCGLRNDTLVIFLGDNGTGQGITSRFQGRRVAGGKGMTTAAGMHVPLVVNWPGRVPPETVVESLVDTTDFLPTLIDAAELSLPEGCDGRSFLPQALGDPGLARDWIYSWYSPRQRDRSVSEFAFDASFKLYRDGRFYDLLADPKEQHPFDPAAAGGPAAAAAGRLARVLDRFVDARPPELDE
jgi:arylsulfatase A